VQLQLHMNETTDPDRETLGEITDLKPASHELVAVRNLAVAAPTKFSMQEKLCIEYRQLFTIIHFTLVFISVTGFIIKI